MKKSNSYIGANEYTLVPGDILMIPLDHITGTSIQYNIVNEVNHLVYYPDNIVKRVVTRSGYADDSDHKMLFVMKYIGNGVFEEMLSSEKFVLEGPLTVYDNGDAGNIIDEFEVMAASPNLGEHFKVVNYNEKMEKEMSIREFVDKLQELIKMIDNYPMGLSDIDHSYTISEYSKKRYLEYTDEQRLEMMKKIKEAAGMDAIDSTNALLREIDKDIEPTKDELNMAYLENQLFDFGNAITR